MTDIGSKYAPKSLTFSEVFTLSTLLATYANYAVMQLWRPIVSSVGSPVMNSAMFAPWLSIVCFLPACFLLNLVMSRLFGKAVACNVLLFATLCGLGGFYLQQPVYRRVMVVLKYDANIRMIF